MKEKNVKPLVLMSFVLLMGTLGLMWGGGGLQSFKTIMRDPDEVSLSLSILDRFLGVPSTDLQLPGSGVQLFTLPWVIGDYIVNNFLNLSADTFTNYMVYQYRSPMRIINSVRMLIMSSCLLSFGCLFFMFYRQTKDVLSSWLSIFIVATIPVVWQHTTLAMSDGLGLSLASISIAITVILNGPASIGVAGLLLGWAIASKLTFVIILPFAFGIVLQKKWLTKKQTLFYLFMIIAGFLIACPYIWIEPIRFFKAVLGNFSGRGGSPIGWIGSLYKVSNILTPGIFCMVFLYLFFYARKETITVIGMSGTFFLLLLSIANNSVIYDRYILPATVPASYAASRVLYLLSWKKISQNKQFAWGALLAAIVLLISAVNIASYSKEFQALISMDKNFRNVQHKIYSLTRNRKSIVFAPSHWSVFFYEKTDQESFNKMEGLIKKGRSDRHALTSFLSKRNISKKFIAGFRDNFDENEKASMARLRLLGHEESFQTMGLIPYASEWVEAERIGGVTLEEAMVAWKQYELQGISVVFLMDNNLHLDLKREGFATVSHWGFGAFTIYCVSDNTYTSDDLIR